MEIAISILLVLQYIQAVFLIICFNKIDKIEELLDKKY